ncbi:hypothetical protein AMK59_2924 [Oryctes borbonicus]|uniref:Phosphatidylinositol N-acetylglucosaminyltransferase subunit Q n=1 Tax=Oryctes borbonicus TaxID=1629725 RepID=A0A0T6BEY1_9SCAR|nr:hypothetical protein AMK59_2924 [Oryctes borbonicus]
MNSVFIFVPNTLDMDNIGFLEGFAKRIDDNLIFYVTSDKLLLEAGCTVGYCSSQTPYNMFTANDSEWLHVNNTTREFTINNINTQEYDDRFTIILYDIKAFSKCDITTFKLQKYGDQFNELRTALNKLSYKMVKPRFMILYIVFMFLIEKISEIFRKGKKICQYSSILLHSESSINTLKWIINSIQNSEIIPIKVYNTILSKVIDILIGFIALYIFFEYETIILKFLNDAAENIIYGLKNLLIFLMGSPIGLKLNYAFNTTLGTFFFYHIFLWKTFMQFIRPYLYSVFYILLFPASFGLSFQAAILDDLIKVCTIHVYCIYIYAARLYGLQINGLISLWRLFIGRKYNPLRNRIDSHQYSHNQLFIGTLGFTIFLFLLPTTLLYYVVFTVFRLVLKVLNLSLIYLRVLLQHLPIHSIVLWLIDSPLIAATIVISAKSEVDDIPVVLHATLKSLPLMHCIKSTTPSLNFEIPKIPWYQELKNIFIGKHL